MVKNKDDVRYVRSEKKLMSAFLKVAKKTRAMNVRPGQVTKEAGLAGSTLYRHHKTLWRLVDYNERRVLGEYGKILRRVEGSGGNLQDIMTMTLDFTLKKQELFEVMEEMEYAGIFRRMGRKLWHVVSRGGNNYGKVMREIEETYSYEVAAVLVRWVRGGFLEEERENCVSDLVKLSQNPAKRLNFLV